MPSNKLNKIESLSQSLKDIYTQLTTLKDLIKELILYSVEKTYHGICDTLNYVFNIVKEILNYEIPLGISDLKIPIHGIILILIPSLVFIILLYNLIFYIIEELTLYRDDKETKSERLYSSIQNYYSKKKSDLLQLRSEISKSFKEYQNSLEEAYSNYFLGNDKQKL